MLTIFLLKSTTHTLLHTFFLRFVCAVMRDTVSIKYSRPMNAFIGVLHFAPFSQHCFYANYGATRYYAFRHATQTNNLTLKCLLTLRQY